MTARTTAQVVENLPNRIGVFGIGARAQVVLKVVLRRTYQPKASIGQPAIALPTSGGSLPLFMIEQNFPVPLLSVGSANYDNNQHAEDENVRIQNLWNSIETVAAIMTMKI